MKNYSWALTLILLIITFPFSLLFVLLVFFCGNKNKEVENSADNSQTTKDQKETQTKKEDSAKVHKHFYWYEDSEYKDCWPEDRYFWHMFDDDD